MMNIKKKNYRALNYTFFVPKTV